MHAYSAISENNKIHWIPSRHIPARRDTIIAFAEAAWILHASLKNGIIPARVRGQAALNAFFFRKRQHRKNIEPSLRNSFVQLFIYVQFCILITAIYLGHLVNIYLQKYFLERSWWHIHRLCSNICLFETEHNCRNSITNTAYQINFALFTSKSSNTFIHRYTGRTLWSKFLLECLSRNSR